MRHRRPDAGSKEAKTTRVLKQSTMAGEKIISKMSLEVKLDPVEP